jgi:hypothetical protein
MGGLVEVRKRQCSEHRVYKSVEYPGAPARIKHVEVLNTFYVVLFNGRRVDSFMKRSNAEKKARQLRKWYSGSDTPR